MSRGGLSNGNCSSGTLLMAYIMNDRSNQITLTDREKFLITRALTIAQEDGSIYSVTNAYTDAEIAKTDAEIETIEGKLS